MDKKTAIALEKSIKHWEENLAAETPEDAGITAEDCALCGIYNKDYPPKSSVCIGCPVSEYTGEVGCINTPYNDANIAFIRWRFFHTMTGKHGHYRRAFRKFAKQEIKFLKDRRVTS